jgi:hypothetical protein
VPLWARSPWYVQPALRARRATTLLAGAALLTLGACGPGERQDANEPKGKFQVDVIRASFASKQALAKRSKLVITVKNTSKGTVPDVAVTLRGLNYRSTQPDVADPTRPRFVINGKPKTIGGFAESQDESPDGGQTAYVDTWTLGALRPGEQRTFTWGVTAVKAGPYKLRWTVAAGLDGKAKAVDANTGRPPTGQFAGKVSGKAPQTRIADDGHTVIQGTR